MKELECLFKSSRVLIELPNKELLAKLTYETKLTKKNESFIESVLKNSLFKGLKYKSTIVFLFWITNSPQNCLQKVKKNGLLRISKFNFNVSMFEFLLTKTCEIHENLLSEQDKLYFKNKKVILKIAQDLSTIQKEVNSYFCINKETFFKSSLAFLDFLFMKNYYPSFPTEGYLKSLCKEDIADAISFLIFSFLEKYKLTSSSFSKMNNKCFKDSSFFKVIENASKIRRFMKYEILVDCYDYNLKEEIEHIRVIPLDFDFFKAIKLGYSFTEYQQYNTLISNSDAFKSHTSLFELSQEFSEKCLKQCFYKIAEPIPRYVFQIFDFPELWDLFKTDALYAEDYLVLKFLNLELHATIDEILNYKITPNLTVKTIIKINRFFNFLRWAFSHFLESKMKNEPEMVLQSILPVFEIDKIVSILSKVVSKEASYDFFENLAWGTKSFLDVQYQPFFKFNGWLIAPLNILGLSNQVRNIMMKNKCRMFSDNLCNPLLDKIAIALKQSGIKAHKDLKFNFHGEEGDIDGLIIIGETAFVFEAKNSLTPASTSELRTSFDYVKKAVSQLDKIEKLFYIEKFKSYITIRHKIDLKKVNKVVTCILFGNRLFYGYKYKSHPIIFINELTNFLKNQSIILKNKEKNIYSGNSSFEQKLTNFIFSNPIHKVTYTSCKLTSLSYKLDTLTITEPQCLIDIEEYAVNLESKLPVEL